MTDHAELELFLRAHTVKRDESGSKKKRQTRSDRRRSRYTILLSCPEPFVVDGIRIIGAFQVKEAGMSVYGGLICDDATTDEESGTIRAMLRRRPTAMKVLGKKPGVHRRSDFAKKVLRRSANDLEATIIGFNLPVDLSNLAVDWSIARAKKYKGDFSLIFREYIDKNGIRRPDSYMPRVAMKAIDGFRAFFGLTSNRREGLGRQRENMGEEPYSKRGSFLDCRTLAFALTGDKLDLREACSRMGFPVAAVGSMAEEQADEIDISLQRLARVAILHQALLDLHSRISSTLPAVSVFSAASYGKDLLRQMGLNLPGLNVDSGLGLSADHVNGWAMASYVGGRADNRIRNFPVPVAYCDFKSMYLTVCVHMGIWDLLSAEQVIVEDATEEANKLLDEITAEDLLSPERWRDLLVLVEIEAEDDILPTRCNYGKSTNQAPSIGVNHVASPFPLVYTLADCIASKILTGKAPRVRRAIRFRPDGQQSLKPVSIYDLPKMEPKREDLFKCLVEARYKMGSQGGDPPHIRDLMDGFLKQLANSTSYGILIELLRMEDQPCDVDVYSLESFKAAVENPEKPGEFYMPVVATLITGAARLMLALAEERVSRLGGSYAFMDTDSIAIVSTREGGQIPCLGGAIRTQDGESAIKALSHEEVAQAIEDFAGLNPYDQALVPGSILELEKENFAEDDDSGESRTQLWAYVVAAKRFVLFNLEDGALRIRKASKHTLGSYLAPRNPETGNPVNDWITRAWEIILERELGWAHGKLPPWSKQIASRVFRLSRPWMLKWFEDLEINVRPYSLMEHVVPARLPGSVPLRRGKPLMLVRPIPSGSDVPERWIDIHDSAGPAYRVISGDRQSYDETTIVGETYADLIGQHTLRPEKKSADFTGEPCSRHSIGLLHRRSVWISGIRYIGKEANQFDLMKAGLITHKDDYLSEYSRDIREYIPEILQKIPVNSIKNALEISTRYAYSLRSGERIIPDKRLPEITKFSAKFAREFLLENNQPNIPDNDELAIIRMVNFLRNSENPS